MGNPRNWTTTFNARTRELEAFLRSNKVTKARRKPLIERAAAGRQADIQKQAREALQERRVRRAIDIISGAADL